MRILLRNHSTTDYQIWKGDRIARITITQINDSDLMEADKLRGTERAAQGFGSTDPIPTRAPEAKMVTPTILFLHADASSHEHFDATDQTHHERLAAVIVLMSNTIISKVESTKFVVEFLEHVKRAAEQDQEW